MSSPKPLPLSRQFTPSGGVVVPSYRPAWWLPDPHTATIWGRVGRREPLLPSPELPVRVESWETPDGDFVEVARMDPVGSPVVGPNVFGLPVSGPPAVRQQRSQEAGAQDAGRSGASDAPRLLLLHGLEGGLHSHYARALFREARARGWGADLLLFRSCGPTPNRLPRTYHSGETSDARWVIGELARRHPTSKLGVVGVSLGGNVLCKLLGEQSPDGLPAQVVGAVAMSVPYDLARASGHIGQGFGAIYERNFLRSLIPKALGQIDRHIDRNPELARLRPVRDSRSLRAFDNAFTAPLHGFADATDYYTRSSSLQFLGAIRRPTLLLSAVDDPFLPSFVLQEVADAVRGNPSILTEFHPRGGHVGFTAGPWPWRAFYYGEWRACEFLSPRFGTTEAVM